MCDGKGASFALYFHDGKTDSPVHAAASDRTVMHDYIAELYTVSADGNLIVEDRNIILAENDSEAQRQAREWTSMAVLVPHGSKYLRLRHDTRMVVQRELV